MIEVVDNIGDNRRCSLSMWEAKDWQALGTASGLPRPSRVQDYMKSGKVIGQSHYFLIEELPLLVAWLEKTGREYRLRNFKEAIPPSAEQLKARAYKQEQEAAKAALTELTPGEKEYQESKIWTRTKPDQDKQPG